MRRNGFIWLVAFWIGVPTRTFGAGPAGDDGLLLREHFAGLVEFGRRPDLASVQAVLALPESQRLIDTATTRIAARIPGWFGVDAGSTNVNPEAVAVVRELVRAESYLEVTGTAERVRAWALAARLDDAGRARVGAGLGKALAARFGVGAPADPAAWDLAAGAGRLRARFAAVNGWAVVGGGDGVFDRLRDTLQKSGEPEAGWSNRVFRLDADFVRLGRLLGWAAEPPGPIDQWPRLHLATEPRGGRLRTTAQFEYARPLSLAADDWQIPTGLIREPLIGFTAMRNADAWINRLGIFREMKLEGAPRQLFLWSLAGPAWQQYFSGPVATPTNLMTQLAQDLPLKIMTNGYWKGQTFGLRVTNNTSRIEMHGIPYFQPFLESVTTPSGPQVHGGLFRLPSRNAPPPAELLAQVSGRTNLVLYDWETTGKSFVVTNPPGTRGPLTSTNLIGRLIHFKHLYQFIKMSSSLRPSHLPANASGAILIPGGDWIDAAAPLLGDSVTEVTRTGPSELSAVRLSQLGLTSLELIHLLRWLENPGFPGWQEPPPPAANERASGPAAGRGTGAPVSPGTPAAPPRP